MNRFAFGLVASLLFPAALVAQAKTEGELGVSPHILKVEEHTPADKQFNTAQLKIVGKTVLVSIRVDGKLLKQTEIAVERNTGWLKVWQLPVGDCEVTIQGEGVKTIVKKGLKVLPDACTILNADLVAGEGLRVIDYTRSNDVESLQERVRALEAALESLKAGR